MVAKEPAPRHSRFGDREPKPECGGELEIIIEVGEEPPPGLEGSADIDGSTHSRGRFSVTQAIVSFQIWGNKIQKIGENNIK